MVECGEGEGRGRGREQAVGAARSCQMWRTADRGGEWQGIVEVVKEARRGGRYREGHTQGPRLTSQPLLFTIRSPVAHH